MATIVQDLQQIRTAVYGEEVREAIADGIEQCYTDTTNGVNMANAAANSANVAANSANVAANSANQIVQRAENLLDEIYVVSVSNIAGDDYRLVCAHSSS